MIYVRESHVEKMGKIQDVPYEILNVLEFNRCQHILTCILAWITCVMPNEVDYYPSVLCLVRESASLLYVVILKADWFSTVR